MICLDLLAGLVRTRSRISLYNSSISILYRLLLVWCVCAVLCDSGWWSFVLCVFAAGRVYMLHIHVYVCLRIGIAESYWSRRSRRNAVLCNLFGDYLTCRTFVSFRHSDTNGIDRHGIYHICVSSCEEDVGKSETTTQVGGGKPNKLRI